MDALSAAMEGLTWGAGTVAAALSAMALANLVRVPPAVPPRGWRPFATVIVPCRGHHQGLDENLRSFLAQDYGPFELLVVVDSKEDSAVSAVESAIAGDQRARLLVSEPEAVGHDWPHGKIVALWTGIQGADPRSEVLVFADADGRAGPHWLASLVGPLRDPAVGGSTGFRWYTGGDRPTLLTALRDAWNGAWLDAMRTDRYRFLWGGSMAVRREDFDRWPVAQAWRQHFAEDVALTRVVERAGMRTAFAPGAIVATAEEGDRAAVRDWLVRQAAFTLASVPRLDRESAALGLSALACAVAGAAMMAVGRTAVGLLLLAPVMAQVPLAVLRRRLAVRAVPGLRRRPARETILQVLVSPAVPALALWLKWRARRAGKLTWRGRQYLLGELVPGDSAR